MLKQVKKNEITDIQQQKNSTDRYSVFIDGEFAFGICDFDLYTLKLRIGDILSDERIREIEKIIDTDKCKNYAVALVSKKMYSKKEITDKMKNRGYSLTAISNVISILEEYGYINDEFFTSAFVETYMKKYGIHKIRYELKNKGVDDEIVNKYLCNFENDENLFELIKQKTRGKVLDRDLCGKLIRSFVSKGFEYEKIKSCLSKLTEDVDDFE